MVHFGICIFVWLWACVDACEPSCIYLSYCTSLHCSHKADERAPITLELRNGTATRRSGRTKERDKERQSHLHFNCDYIQQVNAQPHSYVHTHINTCQGRTKPWNRCRYQNPHKRRGLFLPTQMMPHECIIHTCPALMQIHSTVPDLQT